MTMRRFLAKLVLFVILCVSLDGAIASFLKKGVQARYGLDRSSRILCVGNSRLDQALDAAALERGLGVPVAKYVLHGWPHRDFLTLIRHYFESSPTPPKVVIYNLDAGSLDPVLPGTGQVAAADRNDLSANPYQLLYPFMDDPVVYDFLRSREPSWQEFQLRRFVKTLRFNNYMFNVALRSRLHLPVAYQRNAKADVPLLQAEARRAEAARSAVEGRVFFPGERYLDEAIRYVRSCGARIVFVYVPDIDLVRTATRERDYRRLVERLREHARRDPGVVVVTALKKYEGRHELFIDGVHFNGQGEKLATEEVVQVLRGL